MASLTHVNMWSAHGWIKVTADEAAKQYPVGTVSAHSGLFMCDLCGQYVTLTNAGKNVRHFKHSRGEESKDCPERIYGSSTEMTYNAREYELPIRLCNITSNQFDLELGLLYVPQSILEMQEMQKVIIQSSERREDSYVYSFERLNVNTLTYLYIGSVPALKYMVICSENLRTYWPQEVKGISISGSVFDQQTRRKLTDGADVQIGKKYFLLCASEICQKYRGVESTKVCEKRTLDYTWYIYEIRATAMEEEAAKFFLNLHCRLTEHLALLEPVWPVCVRTPYVFYHAQSQFFIHVRGSNKVITKTFPRALMNSFFCPNEKGEVVEIDCSGRQQLVSIGRTSITY